MMAGVNTPIILVSLWPLAISTSLAVTISLLVCRSRHYGRRRLDRPFLKQATVIYGSRYDVRSTGDGSVPSQFLKQSPFRRRAQERASLSHGTSNQDNANPEPVWLNGADRVITARLLLTQDGPKVHWSHYDP
jgi:hypothetical protein